jgi:hypothetical protein
MPKRCLRCGKIVGSTGPERQPRYCSVACGQVAEQRRAVRRQCQSTEQRLHEELARVSTELVRAQDILAVAEWEVGLLRGLHDRPADTGTA